MAPAGRDEVTTALIDSAAELFAERGPRATTVRDIAAHADVNHGLVHRHFGSKEKLLGAVLDRDARRIAEGSRTGRDLDRYLRVLAFAILEGEDPSELQAEFPTVSMLVGRFVEGGLDESGARVEAAIAVAQAMGWLLFESFLTPAAGLDDHQLEVARSRALGNFR